MWMLTKMMFVTTMKTKTSHVFAMARARAAGLVMDTEWVTDKDAKTDNAGEAVEEDHNPA